MCEVENCLCKKFSINIDELFSENVGKLLAEALVGKN